MMNIIRNYKRNSLIKQMKAADNTWYHIRKHIRDLLENIISERAGLSLALPSADLDHLDSQIQDYYTQMENERRAYVLRIEAIKNKLTALDK